MNRMSFEEKLTDSESQSAIVKTLIYAFKQVDNEPTTAQQLATFYVEQKDGIHQRKEGNRDITTGLRANISLWNDMAKKNRVGKHPLGKDGCNNPDFHRVCKKKLPKEKIKYWISCRLAVHILVGDIQPCRRAKIPKSAVIIKNENNMVIKKTEKTFEEKGTQVDFTEQANTYGSSDGTDLFSSALDDEIMMEMEMDMPVKMFPQSSGTMEMYQNSTSNDFDNLLNEFDGIFDMIPSTEAPLGNTYSQQNPYLSTYNMYKMDNSLVMKNFMSSSAPPTFHHMYPPIACNATQTFENEYQHYPFNNSFDHK